MADDTIELVAQELIDKVGIPDMPLALAIAKVAIAAERERCARIAREGCLVPPDGGSPTEAEIEMCEHIATAISRGEP